MENSQLFVFIIVPENKIKIMCSINQAIIQINIIIVIPRHKENVSLINGYTRPDVCFQLFIVFIGIRKLV